VKTPSSGPSRLLRRLGAVVGLTVAGGACLALLAALGLMACLLGGPAFVELLQTLHGR
jgi:hypothetical protein